MMLNLYCHNISSLRNLQLEEWGNNVTVVSCDMRKWQAPEKVLLQYIHGLLRMLFVIAYLFIKILTYICTLTRIVYILYVKTFLCPRSIVCYKTFTVQQNYYLCRDNFCGAVNILWIYHEEKHHNLTKKHIGFPPKSFVVYVIYFSG